MLGGINLQSGGPETYINERFNYSLQIPKKWRISESGYIPLLFNYTPRTGGPQGLFPKQGAEIYVVPLSAVQQVLHAEAMEKWITVNLEHHHFDIIRKKISDPVDDVNAPHNILQVEADFERDPDDQERQHELNYYFTLRNVPFRLMLLYWKDNHQITSQRAVCWSVLRSIRAKN
jgi:hypothetical protein